MKTVHIKDVHLRRKAKASRPVYRACLTGGIFCGLILSVLSHASGASWAAIFSLIIHTLTAVFWIWE